jgi:ribosomal protein S18 acetylase RimI-like enzyme
MDRFVVERATLADAAAVEALLDSVSEWLSQRGIDQWTAGTFGPEVDAVARAGDLYVARRDDRPVGCFMLETTCPGWMAEWLTQRSRQIADAMYVGRLAVAREAAGGSIGVRLLDEAAAITRRAERRYLRLNSPAGNQALRRFYLGAGFEDLGTAELDGPNREAWVCSVFERPAPDEHASTRLRVTST